MNEVETLYKNTGIEKHCTIYPTVYDCGKQPHVKCENCSDFQYPQLTAEKQLNLIKWLIKKNITGARMLNYCEKTKKYYYIIFHREELTESELFNFDDALAGLFNNLWIDLTDNEKQEIKEILK